MKRRHMHRSPKGLSPSPAEKDRRRRQRAKTRKQMGDDDGFAAFIRTRPCGSCCRPAPSVVAHIMSRGAGHGVLTLNGVPNVLPLCAVCHSEQHTLGWEKFRTLGRNAGFDELEEAAAVRSTFYRAE